jgi:hypothetical protein
MQVEETYTDETIKLMEYVESKEAPLIHIVRTHQHNANAHYYKQPINLNNPFKVKQSK